MKSKFRLFSFLFFFGLTGTYFVLDSGLKTGLHLTLLVWSFFVLCIPFPRGAQILSSVIDLFTTRSIHYARFATWLLAILINALTYLTAPYLYVSSMTTFLLYRILSNPWPYWLIIFTSALASIYSALITPSNANTFSLRHAAIKSMFIAIGLITFFYLSYTEMIVFLYAKTCE